MEGCVYDMHIEGRLLKTKEGQWGMSGNMTGQSTANDTMYGNTITKPNCFYVTEI